MSKHEIFMQRCLDLAMLGVGSVAPNPLVGSVIVHNGKIIGEGYHRQFGKAHAEVNAIHSVKDQSLLHESTLYVNLEPCSHYGKTPPCAQLIIDKKIPRVVVGIKDPNKKVAGKGIKLLQKADVEVEMGILEDACSNINKRFLTYQQQKRPYIILKWAQTLDGFIDIERKNNLAQPTWITGDLSLRLVHRFRAAEEAILVGTNTVLQDNPLLTVRNWSGRNPVRIIIDKNLRLPELCNIFNNQAETIIINSIKNEEKENLKFVYFDFEMNSLQQLLTILYKKGIQSIIVEGGAKTTQNFIDDNLWDEAQVFVGKKMFFSGVKAPNLKKSVLEYQEYLNDDELFIFENTSKTL